jgi:hypothetical protein
MIQNNTLDPSQKYAIIKEKDRLLGIETTFKELGWGTGKLNDQKKAYIQELIKNGTFGEILTKIPDVIYDIYQTNIHEIDQP